MKKILFGLGVLVALSFPIVGCAYGESSADSSPDMKYVFPSLNFDVLQTLQLDSDFYLEGKTDKELILSDQSKVNYLDISENSGYYQRNYYYPLSVEKMKNARGLLSGEMKPYNVDFLKYFHSIDELELDSLATDLRPIENSKSLKNVFIDSPVTNFGFFDKLTNIEKLDMTVTNELESYNDATIKAVTDISFLNNLNKLEKIDICSKDRLFSAVSLKKSMNKYILVNPFILSKQFKNPDVKITSKTPGFTFEDEILTWNGISSETKELQISWEIKSQDGNFNFSGDSVIPINWID